MRIIFMGTPDFSVPVFQALVDAGHVVVASYSQPPRRAGPAGAKRRQQGECEAGQQRGGGIGGGGETGADAGGKQQLDGDQRAPEGAALPLLLDAEGAQRRSAGLGARQLGDGGDHQHRGEYKTQALPQHWARI